MKPSLPTANHRALSPDRQAVESRAKPAYQGHNAFTVGVNPHLPPHLREIRSILALGLLRLRSRTDDDIKRDLRKHGESSLHFPAHPSVCANRNNRRAA